MLISVIVCTYRRPQQLQVLLECLRNQTYRPFEVLVVDGDAAAGSTAGATFGADAAGIAFRVIPSPKGLTKQRNAGLRAASGEIICLLDDDVTIEPTFLEIAGSLLRLPEMQGVGGVTGYDVLNYPQQINTRWRLRKFFRTVPSLNPGDIDRFGSSVPMSFLPPFAGCRPVGFFYGFCMIYRSAAIAGMFFDEQLPTYGGEDRDFSFRVSQRWRLVMCGDLHLRHFQAPQSRESAVQRMYQTGFGAGRTFAKHSTRAADYLALAKQIVCEFLIDGLAFVKQPSWPHLLMPFARMSGAVAGVRSYRIKASSTVLNPTS